MIDWGSYERCPVCFRSWSCVAIERDYRGARAGLLNVNSTGWLPRYRVWSGRELARAHHGRKRLAG
jgi:hypothetical protein